MSAEILVLSNRDPDAEAIGQLYRRGRQSMVDSVKYLVEAGRRLHSKKESLDHGEWLPWLADNADALGFDAPSTAGRLMKAAKLCASAQYDAAEALRLNRIAWGHNVRGTHQSTGENEWFTPAEDIERARTVLGAIDLDPASHEAAQEIVQAARYFTKADDGLTQEWHGRVWLNPPYAQPLIADFVAKMCSERAAGRVTAAIMLTHSYTSSVWFQEAASVSDAICFPRRRIEFQELDGDKANPTQGQAFFYFGENVAGFVAQFAAVGFVVQPTAAAVVNALAEQTVAKGCGQ
jgi:phage N-6-adenine-methyltransferase